MSPFPGKPSAAPFARWRVSAFLTAVLLLTGGGLWAAASRATNAGPILAPAIDEPAGQQTSEVAVLAGGCFWGVQGVFQHVTGVTSAVSGYAGGSEATAHYEVVSTDTTGHAESVRITFDPRKISYGRLLQIYFSVAHDPTQLNHQGPDEGTQYRSAIFTHGQAQYDAAIASRDREQARLQRPIVTQIVAAPKFWPAEEYHQRYFEKNGGAACHVIPSPR